MAAQLAGIILSLLTVKFRIKTPGNTTEREVSLGKEKSPEHTHWVSRIFILHLLTDPVLSGVSAEYRTFCDSKGEL